VLRVKPGGGRGAAYDWHALNVMQLQPVRPQP
jgi:hypothetical protein